MPPVMSLGQVIRSLVRGSQRGLMLPCSSSAPSLLLPPCSRHCSSNSGVLYESSKITNKLLDADTLYLLDKYSRYTSYHLCC